MIILNYLNGETKMYQTTQDKLVQLLMYYNISFTYSKENLRITDENKNINVTNWTTNDLEKWIRA